jgi:hypothetical protein
MFVVGVDEGSSVLAVWCIMKSAGGLVYDESVEGLDIRLFLRLFIPSSCSNRALTGVYTSIMINDKAPLRLPRIYVIL